MSTMSNSNDKKRKGKWEEGETSVLVEEMTDNIATIEGKSSATLTSHQKLCVWKKITDCVNAQGCVYRTVDEVKKKWADLKSLIKKKERQRRELTKMTRGGPAPSGLKEYEDKILGVLSNTAIEGIEEAIDTFAKSLNDQKDKPVRYTDTEEPLPGYSGGNDSGQVNDTANEDRNKLDKIDQFESDIIMEEECTTSRKQSMKRTRSKQCDCHTDILSIEKERLSIEERKLQLKKEKISLMEKQLEQMETTNSFLKSISLSLMTTDSYLQVSPVMKFPEM